MNDDYVSLIFNRNKELFFYIIECLIKAYNNNAFHIVWVLSRFYHKIKIYIYR